MARFIKTSILLALSAALVSSQTTCGSGTQCPQDTPCCSQYGQCGVGAYCLGGCDPINSFSINSCTPEPVCQNKTIQFTNMDRLIENTKYLGNASEADFVYSGEPVIYQDQVLLTMPENSVGTLLASTNYVWYGKVSAKLKTSGGQGVVTAFILLGDTKDEIDFEFVGYNLTQAQTNFYYQGFLDYNNGGNSSVPGGNSMITAHTYEIDWQPNSITWSIDGNTVRTLEKSTTWNSTANRYDYPQTPTRVQLSLWPAGASSNPEGTIQWSGGPISWNSQYMSNGYYYAAFSEVTMECYSPPSGANISGSSQESYVFTDTQGLNTSVSITDDNTTLSSFDATGLNMTIGAAASSASASGAASTAAQVPGQGSAGTGNNGNRGGSGSSDSSSGSSSSSASGSASTGFVQGSGSSGKSAAPQAVSADHSVLVGSFIAMCALLMAMLAL